MIFPVKQKKAFRNDIFFISITFKNEAVKKISKSYVYKVNQVLFARQD